MFIQKYTGGRGDLQSSAQRISLQESQEARIDHPCVPAPKQFELLISVPVQCCAVLPFTQCWFDLFDLAFLLDYVNAFQLGYSLDKVYQVGIAKSFKLKPCRTNYPHDSTRPIWNQLQFLKPVQCVNVAPAYIVRGGSIPLCCRGSVQTRQVRDPVQARNAKAAERHANKSSCRLRP